MFRERIHLENLCREDDFRKLLKLSPTTDARLFTFNGVCSYLMSEKDLMQKHKVIKTPAGFYSYLASHERIENVMISFVPPLLS